MVHTLKLQICFKECVEIAVQAASGTNGSDDRDALDTEYRALSDEIQRVAGNTQWNGITLLDDSAGSSE